MNVQDAVAVGVRRQDHLGKVDRRLGGPVVAVPHELARDLSPDVLLRLDRRAADVRRQDGPVKPLERRLEGVVVRARLGRVDVDGGAGEVPALEGRGEGLEVDDGPARGVDEHGVRLHGLDFLFPDQPLGRRRLRDVERHHVGLGQDALEVGDGPGVAEREHVGGVVEHDAHPQALGQDRELLANVAVADDAERLAPDLAARPDALGPLAAVSLGVLFRHTAQQQDGLGQDQLGDRPRVRERGVKDGHALLGRGLEVDLVGADAERADGDQLVGGLEDVGGQLGARADAEKVDVANQVRQLGLGDGGRPALDVAVSGVLKGVDGVLVDALEEQDLDAVLVERGRSHRAKLGARQDRTNAARQSPTRGRPRGRYPRPPGTTPLRQSWRACRQTSA